MTILRKLHLFPAAAATLCLMAYTIAEELDVADSASDRPKILVFSKTAGVHHDSIPRGIQAIGTIGDANGIAVEATEISELFNDVFLAQFDAIVFLNTSGNVFTSEQQAAFERFIRAGGGYVGIHSAAGTEWDEDDPWLWFYDMQGAVFDGHPEMQLATIDVPGYPRRTTPGLPASWETEEEWYNFKRVNDSINVVLSVDESTYDGGTMGDSHPLAWYHTFDGGRSFYIGIGHKESTYDHRYFNEMLESGIRFAVGLSDSP